MLLLLSWVVEKVFVNLYNTKPDNTGLDMMTRHKKNN